MEYKQVIFDRYEEEDYELDELGMIVDRMQILDMDTVDVDDISSYDLEDEFGDMFSPDLFRKGRNHEIHVQLFRMEDDECTDDPIYERSFRSLYQG